MNKQLKESEIQMVWKHEWCSTLFLRRENVNENYPKILLSTCPTGKKIKCLRIHLVDKACRNR